MSPPSMKISAILFAAADTLDRPGAWTQGEFARDTAGNPVSPASQDAVCFCLSGAFRRNLPDLTLERIRPVSEFIARKIGRWAHEWNDSPLRTQADVVAMARSLARQAEKEGL